MKVRNGFVSNSSSSSYVIIVNADENKKIIREIGKGIDVLLEFLRMKKENFHGNEVNIIQYWSGNTNSFEYLDKKTIEKMKEEAKKAGYEEEYFDLVYDVMDDYKEKVRDSGGIVASNSDS